MVRFAKKGNLVASLEWRAAVVQSSFSPHSTGNVLVEILHDFL